MINDPLVIKNQVIKMADILINTSSFIVKARLWDGFIRHKLVIMLSIVAAIVIPYSVYEFVQSNISTLGIFHTPNHAVGIVKNSLHWMTLFDGGNKYIVLILIQMLVMYFSNRTIEYLSGIQINMTTKDLIQAQYRVIVVAIRNWMIEICFGIVISLVIGIFGPDWLVKSLKFILACYFVGYLFIDSYNFTFGLSVTDSSKIVQKHVGAAFVVGLVAKVLLLLPFIGSLFVSFICSVGATWYMHTSDDRHAATTAFEV